MMRILGILTIVILLAACHEKEIVKTDFTGNETTYSLMSGSTYPINGSVIFKEKADGTTLVRVELSGTEGEIKHPVHLHMGAISTPDADVAALLNPVIGKTGLSETTLTRLSDETPVTYQQLLQLEACVKVHLAEAGPDKNIILAGGNIGLAESEDTSGGRSGIQVCKSE